MELSRFCGYAAGSMVVYPDFSVVDDTSLPRVVGALLLVTLIVAVLMLVVSVVAWALGAATGNERVSVRARAGVWASLGTAIVAGALLGWLNYLLDLGRGL